MRRTRTPALVLTLAFVPAFLLAGCEEPAPEEPEGEVVPGTELPETGEPEAFLPQLFDGDGEARRIALAPDNDELFVQYRPGPDSEPSLHTSRWDPETETWSPLEPATIVEEGEEDLSPFVSHDGQYLLFSSRRGHEEAQIADESIWTTRWDPAEEDWMEPWPLPAVNTVSWDGAPSLAANANLYFSSFREGPAAGRDIYMAPFVDASWELPEPLQGEVNTSSDEVDPWISLEEEFILFASDREGQLDLYVSYRDDATGEWSEAEPLEALNTEADEHSPTLSPREEFLFFNRDNEILWLPIEESGIDLGEEEPAADQEAPAGAQ